MRTAVLLSLLVAFAPVAQAGACTCASEPSPEATTVPHCCCDHAPGESCCCGCGEQEDERSPGAASGCACTHVQPQISADSDEQPVLAEALSVPDMDTLAPVRQADTRIETLRGEARPRSSAPLLL